MFCGVCRFRFLIGHDGLTDEAEFNGLDEEGEELPEAFDSNVEEVRGEDGVECFVAYMYADSDI